MKKGLRKFVKIDDGSGRKLLLRTQYPWYVFEIDPADDQHLVEIGAHSIITRYDIHKQGDAPDSYLMEALRYYMMDIEPNQPAHDETRKISAIPLPDPNLKQLFEFLNGAHVAEECFGKSRQWLHQRINGYNVNGKPAEFTAEQKWQFGQYLKLKAVELMQAADAFSETGEETVARRLNELMEDDQNQHRRLNSIKDQFVS